MIDLTLVSHHLCPYVQRAAISLTEKQVPYERLYVDLADKPEWFKQISPLGKVPLLKLTGPENETVIFESAVIVEFLEDTQPSPLHPSAPVERARARAWIEFGSAVLNTIARFYSAASLEALDKEAANLAGMFGRVEAELGQGPWFAGIHFGLVDATFGPVFRYFDTFEAISDFGIFDHTPKVRKWRHCLAHRSSVINAVNTDYQVMLLDFLVRRQSALSGLIAMGHKRTAQPLPV